jgi:hypothetical protein
MRDSMLATSGQLDARRFGPPLRAAPDDAAARVRSIYLFLDRERPPGVLRVFDFPSPDSSAPERPKTTVAQQALFLLNSPFVIAQADSIAATLDGEFGPDDIEGRIRSLYRSIYLRDPAPPEMPLLLDFMSARRRAIEGSSETTRHSAELARSAWSYGYGRYDEASARLESFTALPHFSGDAWQGGERWPDAELEYLRLTARGGHVGIDRAHAAVRRWTAPNDGAFAVSGRLTHGEEDCGDGVRAWVVSSRGGELGHFEAHRSAADTNLDAIELIAGDTIDFIVDCRDNHSCDLFEWAPTIRPATSAGSNADAVLTNWDAARDFGTIEAAQPHSSPWSELAQAMLESNEFLFSD